METLREVWDGLIEFLIKVGEVFTTNLFSLGQSEISLGTILYFIISFTILTWTAPRFRNPSPLTQLPFPNPC